MRKPWTQERCQQARYLYEQGLPLTEVARLVGSNTGRVADGIKKAGGVVRPANPDETVWTSERCTHARVLYEEGRTLKDIAIEMSTTAARVGEAVKKAGGAIRPQGPPRGERNGSWRGGRKLDVDGYVLVLAARHPHATQSGYVREHRLVMEAVLGRYLTETEVVHHKNGDKADNRPENLELFDCNAEHLKSELTGRVPNWTPEGKARMGRR